MSQGLKEVSWTYSRCCWYLESQLPGPLLILAASVLGRSMYLDTVAPNFFGTRDWFHRRQFFYGLGVGGVSVGMIHVHYLYWALYFCYYYISSTSGHQALDPRGWGPLPWQILTPMKPLLFSMGSFAASVGSQTLEVLGNWHLGW